MSYLFLMTLGGSVMLVACLVWERLFEKSMTQHMGYAAFITVLLTFLVPWVWIKGIYRFVLFAFWDESVIGDAKGLVNIADLKTQESAYRTEDYRVLVIFAVIWSVCYHDCQNFQVYPHEAWTIWAVHQMWRRKSG